MTSAKIDRNIRINSIVIIVEFLKYCFIKSSKVLLGSASFPKTAFPYFARDIGYFNIIP